jgi:type II secretory pathway pseudopilin PulG
MKKQKSLPAGRQGFTIVELLIYMGLLTILMTILTRLFTATVDVQLSSEATGVVEEDSRYIYSRLAYDLTRADSIVTPAIPGESSNSLTILIGPVVTTYSVNDTNFMLTNDRGSSALNSYGTGVSHVTFTQLGQDAGKKSIQVKYTLTSTIQSSSGRDTRTMETTITQR